MIHFKKATKFMKAGQSKKYIINNVTLDFPPQLSIGLLGRNGAGKSTLLQIIAGTLELDSGSVRKDATVSWPLGFAGSFQPAMTGEQNVRFVARIYGVDTGMLVEYVQDFAELGPYFYMPVSTYSSGMKARLAFGVSMGIEFDYYLVDEITAVGDTAFKRKCHKVFRERLKNSNVVMVSHSTSTIRDYCDCGLVLENGTLSYYQDVRDAIEQHDSNMRKH